MSSFVYFRLRPSTRITISMIAEVKKLEKDKEHLTTNLHRAEYEVKNEQHQNIKISIVIFILTIFYRLLKCTG